jgi:peroxiredoxin
LKEKEENSMVIQEGDRLPSVHLKQLTPQGVIDISSENLFGSKKVVLFAMPGAFLPGSTLKHIPGILANCDEMAARGVRLIVCLSVNDPYVMLAWSKQLNAEDKVTMVSDGNGDFTKAMGLEMDGRGFGGGIRSNRYAAVINDGILTKLLLDKDGAVTVSTAESVLAHL